MFIQFFFLLLSLILISFMPEKGFPFWVPSPPLALGLGLIFYLTTLGIIYLQTRILKRFKRVSVWSLHLALIEILLFLCFYQFGLGSHRLLLAYFFPSSAAAFSLTLYLGGVGWAFYSITHNPSYSREQVLFIIPLCIPFMFFGLLYDGLYQIDNWLPFSSLLLDALLLLTTLIYMPFVIVKCWRCQPIQDQVLVKRLEEICQQLHFTHAGLKIWTVMKHTFTAGIIGVVPRFRYVMFTERLLQTFTPIEIEAILVHEIGHSRHRHLLFYPFILMGMFLSGYLFFLFILEPLASDRGELFAFKESVFISYLTLFILYASFLGVYFRFVFGFFSRLFERQADLHIFKTSLAPVSMIQALDHIAILSGGIHHQPSWHHFSIQERINFLNAAIQDPGLIARHHSRVKWWLWVYFILLGMSTLLLINTASS